jgi:hypothetical protein
MARVTQSTGGDYETHDWTDDWYSVFLKEVRQIDPVGSIGYMNQPRKNASAQLVWATDDDVQAWIFDRVSLTPSMQQDKTPSACLSIMCALAGKDPYQAGQPWIDNATLEFGFEQPGGEPNSRNWPVFGRIENGVKLQLRGTPKPTDRGTIMLRPEKYRSNGVQRAARQVATVGADMQLSPDGQWAWNGSEWIPNPARG